MFGSSQISGIIFFLSLFSINISWYILVLIGMFGAILQNVGREPELQANNSENADNTLQNRSASYASYS